jgi:hypothetical protein
VVPDPAAILFQLAAQSLCSQTRANGCAKAPERLWSSFLRFSAGYCTERQIVDVKLNVRVQLSRQGRIRIVKSGKTSRDCPRGGVGSATLVIVNVA